MLPCPKCQSGDNIELAGKGPEFVEITKRKEDGTIDGIFRHSRPAFECMTCNVVLVEDPSVGLLVEAMDKDGKPLQTRKDESDKHKLIVKKDRDRIVDIQKKMKRPDSRLTPQQ